MASSTEKPVDSSFRSGHTDYMASSAVGSRELKTRLGMYLRRVREGRTFVVTDRGEPVAELRPIEHRGSSVVARLARLRARGTISRQQARPLAPFKPARLSERVSAARLISEEREDRF
jgi:prevent-host-death family protein